MVTAASVTHCFTVTKFISVSQTCSGHSFRVVAYDLYGIAILTIVSPSHDIFYCYDIPRWYRHIGIDGYTTLFRQTLFRQTLFRQSMHSVDVGWLTAVE